MANPMKKKVLMDVGPFCVVEIDCKTWVDPNYGECESRDVFDVHLLGKSLRKEAKRTELLEHFLQEFQNRYSKDIWDQTVEYQKEESK